MRLALLLLSLPAFGQIEIRYSQQADEVVRALVGTVPKGVKVYRADVVNIGATEARIFPSRVGFEAAAIAPMQDPESALFAAQHFKDTRWWVVSLGVMKEAAKYGGPVVLGLATGGVAVPAIVSGLAGGIGGSAVVLEGYRKEAAKLTVPATWLRDGLPEIILKPGEPVPYLLALGGNPAMTFTAKVGDSRLAAGIETCCANIVTEAQTCVRWLPCGRLPESQSSDGPPQLMTALPTLRQPTSPIVTHPMVDEEIIYDDARILAMIREHSAERARLGMVD